MSQRTNILFPVEILNRELDARLFLAAHVANKNNRVFIGQFHAIRRLAGTLEGGLYVGQNIFSQPFWDTSYERYNFLKSRGLSIIHLDEEGGVYEGDEERWKWRLKRRLDPTKLAGEDSICTWGNFQRDYYQSLRPACEENIKTTGHPRFDVYKKPYRDYYREDVTRLRSYYGDFVLVNTSWPMVNNARGLSETFSLRRGYDTGDGQRRYDHVSRWTHQTQVLAHFVKLVTYLTIEFPDLKFVIRPHPAEDIRYYETIFQGIPNVHVVHEGSVAPWLFASRALIQDGCTTGIEAYFGDVPVINFKAIRNERYDLIIPDSLSSIDSSEEEVGERIRQIISQGQSSTSGANEGKDKGQPAAIAAAMIDNLQHNAFEQLTQVIVDVASSLPTAASPFSTNKYIATDRLRRGLSQTKRGVRARLGVEKTKKMQEFSGFESRALTPKIQRIQDILQKEIRCSIHSGEIVSIE